MMNARIVRFLAVLFLSAITTSPSLAQRGRGPHVRVDVHGHHGRARGRRVVVVAPAPPRVVVVAPPRPRVVVVAPAPVIVLPAPPRVEVRVVP